MSVEATASGPLGAKAMKIALDTQKTEQTAIANSMAEGTAKIQEQAQKADVAGGGANVDMSV